MRQTAFVIAIAAPRFKTSTAIILVAIAMSFCDVANAGKKKTTAVVPCAIAMRDIALPATKLNGENTVMRGQFSQFPAAHTIPRQYIDASFRQHGSDKFFPGIGDDVGIIQLNTGSRPAEITAPKLPPKPVAQLTAAEKQRLAENYVRDTYPEGQLDDRTKLQIAKATAADPAMMRPVLQSYEQGKLTFDAARPSNLLSAETKSATSVSTSATTTTSITTSKVKTPGPNSIGSTPETRYFWFTPEGDSVQLPARVLDMQINPDGSARIFAEWTRPGNGSERVRHIGTISLAEVKTMPSLTAQLRAEAQEVFFDSLTPEQLNAQVLAKHLKLNPRGHTDFLRAPGISNPKDITIGDKMAILGHHAIRESVESQFGSVDDLLTAAEKSNANWNIIDVMGRLNPEYAIKRFRATNGFKYMYVITEDGQLKISPLGGENSNLRPQLLRLGHGRKIYSAGTFTIDPSNAIDLTLRTADYASFDSQIVGSIRAHENEQKFAKAIFQRQANVDVRSVNESEADSWSDMRMDFATGQYEHVNPIDQDMASGSRPKSDGTKRDSEWGDETVADYMKSLLKDRKQAAVVKDWDRENTGAIPPSFEAWKKLRQTTGFQNAQEENIDYAHYILGTNEKMEAREIKSAYRKLIQKFGRRTSAVRPEDSIAGQIINDAYQVFKNRELALKKKLEETQ